MSDRQAYIDGLRELADRLERHPDAPLPYALGGGRSSGDFVPVWDRDEMAAAARCYGGRKAVDAEGRLTLVDGVPGLNLRVQAFGDDICERVEVGTTTVTDYEVPEEVRERYRVEREVPVYETRCPDSLLALDADEAQRVPA